MNCRRRAKGVGRRIVRRVLIAVVLGAVLLPADAPAGVYDGWSRRARITFSGYSKPESLAQFPVLVRLGTNIADFSYSQFGYPASGADLRFANSNDTVALPYDIESWNTGGTSYVWVKVPVLNGTGCSIRAYWGRGGVSAGTGTAWNAGFAAVWHLNNADGMQRDATTNGKHAWPYPNGKSDVTAPGMTCSDTLASGAPGNVIDNNTGTEAWEGTAAARWWKVDLGAGNAKAVGMLRYIMGWQTKDFSIEGSQNDADWTLIYSNQFIFTGIWQTFGFDNPTAYRYYRLNLLTKHTASSGHDPLELEFLERGTNAVVTGKIAGCADFDGVDDELYASRPISLPRSSLSMCMWSKHDVAAAADDAMLGTAGDVNWQSGFGIFYANATLVQFWVKVYNVASNNVTATVTPTAWNHFYATHDGTNLALYVNGQRKANKSCRSPITDSSFLFTLGRLMDPYTIKRYDFDGKLDEVRLENVGRSSNWVWACWFNQASNSAFCTYGPAQLAIQKGACFMFR